MTAATLASYNAVAVKLLAVGGTVVLLLPLVGAFLAR